MNIKDFNLANSCLDIKASGCLDVSKDLSLPQGKSIAELLYGSHNETEETNNQEKNIAS